MAVTTILTISIMSVIKNSVFSSPPPIFKKVQISPEVQIGGDMFILQDF